MAQNIKKYTEIRDKLEDGNLNKDIISSPISLEGFTIPTKYLKYSKEIENFEVYEDDIWLCSFPKTGTTWTQETVWLLQNNLDYEGAKENITNRFPFFEAIILFSDTLFQNQDFFPKNSLEFVRKMSRPRLIKTHLPFCLLPKKIRNGTVKPRIIYIYRDPRDTCLSYYNHYLLMGDFQGTLDNFCELFIDGKVEYGPFFDHVFSFLRNLKNFNALVLKYEDLKTDLQSNIVKISKFLKKEIPSQEDMPKLLDHLSFENMKYNKYVNYEDFTCLCRKLGISTEEGSFMRRGICGSYLAEFTPEMIQKFNSWISSNIEGTELAGIYF